ncbi:DUF6435 family protein [Paraglaciecola sp. Hal342]
MFDFLKSSPVKKLKKQYNQRLEDAMLAQRKGDIRAYATLTAEAEALWSEIETLEKTKGAEVTELQPDTYFWSL